MGDCNNALNYVCVNVVMQSIFFIFVTVQHFPKDYTVYATGSPVCSLIKTLLLPVLVTNICDSVVFLSGFKICCKEPQQSYLTYN